MIRDSDILGIGEVPSRQAKIRYGHALVLGLLCGATILAIFVYWQVLASNRTGDLANSGDEVQYLASDFSESDNAEQEPPLPDVSVVAEPSHLELEVVKTEPALSSAEYFWNLELRRKGLGFFTTDEMHAYETYSVEALENLVDTGDLMAMHMLAEAHLREGDLIGAVSVFELAAVNGSTGALSFLGTFLLTQASNLEALGNRDRFRMYINGFAYYEVAAMRGDLATLQLGIESIDRYDFEMTPSRADMIHQRAEEFYKGLASRRIAQGLPAFDNSIPEYALQHYAFRFAEFENPTGWGLQYY